MLIERCLHWAGAREPARRYVTHSLALNLQSPVLSRGRGFLVSGNKAGSTTFANRERDRFGPAMDWYLIGLTVAACSVIAFVVYLVVAE